MECDTASAPVVGDEARFDLTAFFLLFCGFLGCDDLVCDLRFKDGSSAVTCFGPRGTCSAPQRRITVPDAVSYCCDVVRQDCGPGLRCQAFAVDADIRFSACVAGRRMATSGLGLGDRTKK